MRPEQPVTVLAGNALSCSRNHPKMVIEPDSEPYTFRLLISVSAEGGVAPTLVAYRDEPDRGNGPKDTFPVGPATPGYLEGRFLVVKETDIEMRSCRYRLATIACDQTSPGFGIALRNLARVRGQELQTFLGSCWEATQNCPNTPFQIVLP